MTAAVRAGRTVGAAVEAAPAQYIAGFVLPILHSLEQKNKMSPMYKKHKELFGEIKKKLLITSLFQSLLSDTS